jgi:Ca2+:H+ antiporter
MTPLLKEIRHNPLLWLLALVPLALGAAKVKIEAHTLLFVLLVLAIVPLAALPSHATESVAAKTIATLTASLVTNSGRSAWFVGALLLMVYLVFAMALYLLPPRTQ